MRNSMLWNFRKASLHFLFWGGCVLYAIETVPAFTPLRPHRTVFVSIFSISCLLMILDFKILRFNAWIYVHHFIMFAICAAVWAYFCSPD